MKRIFAILVAGLGLFLSSCNFIGKESNTQTELGAFEYTTYGVGIEETLPLSWHGLKKDASIAFSSSDKSVATINASGEVLGKSIGKTTITAKTKKQEFTCTVEVNDGTYTKLSGEETFIKWEGRNFVYKDMMNCYNSASGFETLFYGTSFTAEIAAGTRENSNNPAKLCVMIDDIHTPEENNIILSADKKANFYVLADNLEEGFHKIRVYKATEALESSIAFKSVKTDGYFWARPNNKKYKIEVYGDSTTVGMNNMRDTDKEVVAPQNGCMTYGWLAAEQIGADINIFARSGIGMNWSWGDNIFMKSQYKHTYCAENNYLDIQTNPYWNFKSYIPDVVVINIGTNDTCCDTGYDEKSYMEEMRKLCQNLINEYGTETKILLCGGVATSVNIPALITISDEFENAEWLPLPTTGGHPSKNKHKMLATFLAEKLEEILK